jgi:hypothetical protein
MLLVAVMLSHAAVATWPWELHELCACVCAGAWLLARCADLEALTYDTRHFGRCLLALFGLGLLFRCAGCPSKAELLEHLSQPIACA